MMTAVRSEDDLKKARDTRAMEALHMKDEQIRILQEQNSKLLTSLDKVEEDANNIQMEKLAVEQDNRNLRDNNFELQSKARAAETQAKRMVSEVDDMDKQLRILTDQNSELLRLLGSEEEVTTKLKDEIERIRGELNKITEKHGALLTTAKTHEELATQAAREGQLRAEEIRILRAETEQLKQQNSELKMKTQVEVDALQEQLRVRKEKQYQLLEKLQAQEAAKRQAEDQVSGMEEQLRGLHARNVELETQIQVETRNKMNVEDANKELQSENTNLYGQNKDLQRQIEKSEKERLRMEAEARDSGDQLREMAEKVFQLLERLKLAELGKTRAMEALKKKEQDMVGLQKKNARLIKESTEEGRSRVKAELDVKVLQDQVRALKKQNQEISQKAKDESREKVRLGEECEQLKEKTRVMESRLSFLLNKVQLDEENRVLQAEDRKKLEAQVLSLSEKADELQHKLGEMGESNKIITQAMRLKQEELNDVSIKYESLSREVEAREAKEGKQDALADSTEDMTGAKAGGADDIDNVRLNEGRGRFYAEAKSVGGGSMLLLRGRKPAYRDWIDRYNANEFLKRAQKTTRFRDLAVERLGCVYGLLMVEEEEKNKMLNELDSRENQLDHLQKKLTYLQDTLSTEEDAKRRMLLRYIHAVKEHAMANDDGSGGVLQLPESNINDEEVHALAALLRNNVSIDELNLRGNNITDDGARALGAVLAGRSGMRLVDLRGNKIGPGAIRVLAEALERSERIRHVYVHQGGKIEALGTGRWANARDGNGANTLTNTMSSMDSTGPVMATVETVCVVDVRDNNPLAAVHPFELEVVNTNAQQMTHQGGSPKNNKSKSTSDLNNGKYNPQVMLGSIGAPPRSLSNSEPVAKVPKKGKKNKVLKNTASAESFKPHKTTAQERAEKMAYLQESSWQGRAGTFDQNPQNGGTVRESLRLRKKDSAMFPPLSDSNSNASMAPRGASPPRGQSAPGGYSSDEGHGPDMKASVSDELVAGAIKKARGGKEDKKKPHTETEKKLFSSPFAQPTI